MHNCQVLFKFPSSNSYNLNYNWNNLYYKGEH